jgi:hypothetical protein
MSTGPVGHGDESGEVFVKWATCDQAARDLRREGKHLRELAPWLPTGTPHELAHSKRALVIEAVANVRPVYFGAAQLEEMTEIFAQLARAPLSLGGTDSMAVFLPALESRLEANLPVGLGSRLVDWMYSAMAMRLTDQASGDVVISHCDAHQQNWVDSNGQVTLVDFGHVCAAPGYWDLAWSLPLVKGDVAGRVELATVIAGEQRAQMVARLVYARMAAGGFSRRRFGKYCIKQIGGIATFLTKMGDREIAEIHPIVLESILTYQGELAAAKATRTARRTARVAGGELSLVGAS